MPELTPVQQRDPDDDPLQVEVIGGRLLISIGVKTLAFAVTHRPGEEDTFTITDPLVAAGEIAQQLREEDEEGTTVINTLLDKAAFDAWENGGEGFDEGPDLCEFCGLGPQECACPPLDEERLEV